MTTAVLTLMVVGAGFELLGIAIVATEIRNDLRHARELVDRPSTSFTSMRPGLGRTASIMRGFEEMANPALKAQHEAEDAAAQLHADAVRHENDLRAAIRGAIAGNARRRVLGVGFLLAGLVLTTAGNVLSVTCT